MATKKKGSFESFKGKGPGLTKKKPVKKKSPKIVCDCGGTIVLKRDAILSYPLKGLKVGKADLKLKNIAELDNNWLECCECGAMSHDTDGSISDDRLAEIYEKLKW